MAKAHTYNNVLNPSLVLLCPQTVVKGWEVWAGSFIVFVGKKVHLSPPSLYALSKYHIIQFTGSELTPKYPLGAPEKPYINCLVEAPLGCHWGSTLNA